MYSDPQAKIILNEFETELFGCPAGLKQGACESPVLFALYIENLAQEIKATNIGVTIQTNPTGANIDSQCNNVSFDTVIHILLYCDNIVLITENEEDLQYLLFIVEMWCSRYRLEVNLTKTNVLHVRGKRCQQSNFVFLFNNRPVPYCESYKYLGATINCHLDYEFTANCLADSAGRALSAVICKMIKNQGFPYIVYSRLIDACVNSVSDYSSEVIGYSSYASATKIFHRAARAFLCLPKSTPIAGLKGEIGWLWPVHRTQLKMVRQFYRLQKLGLDRITKTVYLWNKHLNEAGVVCTWTSELKSIFDANNLLELFSSITCFPIKLVIENLKSQMFLAQWKNLEQAAAQSSKLSLYSIHNDFSKIPASVLKPLTQAQRSAFTKAKLGIFPIRVHTGTFTRPITPRQDRTCPLCPDSGYIEDICHFLLHCPLYLHERIGWKHEFGKVVDFDSLSEVEMLKLALFDSRFIKITAQFLLSAYEKCSKLVSQVYPGETSLKCILL